MITTVGYCSKYFLLNVMINCKQGVSISYLQLSHLIIVFTKPLITYSPFAKIIFERLFLSLSEV